MTRDECVAAVAAWSMEQGRWPGPEDWGCGGLPSRADLRAHWPSHPTRDCIRGAKRLTGEVKWGGQERTVDVTPLKALAEGYTLTAWEGLGLSRRSWYELTRKEAPRLLIWTVDKILTAFERPDIWHVELAHTYEEAA